MRARIRCLNKLLSFFVAASSFLVIFCGVSYGQLVNEDLPSRDGIKLDKIVLHSAFKTAERYDTNIFLSDSADKHDIISILSPSGGFELPFHNGSLSADYLADLFLYGIHQDQDYMNQRVRGLAELELADYKVKVSDIFRIFTDRAANENSVRLRQTVNDIRAGVSTDFERLNLDAGYTNRLEMYDSNDPFFGTLTYEDRNRDNHIIDTTVSYRFLPKTSLLLENDLGFIRYFKSSIIPDSVYDEALVGAQGLWFSKSKINFKAGLRAQGYDNSNIIANKDYIGPVMRGGFDYSPTDSDTIVLELTRTIYESAYSNMNYYNANLFGFNYRHNFTDKLAANLFGSYQLHLYPSESTENGLTAKRRDNYYQGGTSVRYDLRKWISFEAKYEYAQRVSKFDVFDYIDQQVTISGTVGF